MRWTSRAARRLTPLRPFAPTFLRPFPVSHWYTGQRLLSIIIIIIADVDDDFLLVADSKSIAIVHDPSQFEEVRFGKQNYDPDELIDIANSRGAYLGSTNFESLVDSGYLTPSLFGLDLSSQGIKELVQAAETNSDIVF